MYDWHNQKAEAFSSLQVDMLVKKSKRKVLEVASAFDTETTSFIDSNQSDEVGLVYIWQFGIGQTVVYGRYLDDFVDLINTLNAYLIPLKSKLIVYCHNYKYDFAFIWKLFHWDDVFFTDYRTPLYTRVGNIEIRDSLILSGYQSLAKIGKGLRIPTMKMIGDLDYSKMRFPETPLTKVEMKYCEQDIRVLCEYITEKIEDEGTIDKIPYTNTGYVRRYCRNACFYHKDKEAYLTLMDNLTLDVDAYLQANQAFGGGATGPNIRYVGRIMNNVDSYDLKSAYPWAMVTQTFPMSRSTIIPNKEANNAKLFSGYIENYHCIFTVEFWDLMPKTNFAYPISNHKCLEKIGYRESAGRIVSALYIRISMTELDFNTYSKFYEWSEMKISRMRIYKKGYLPPAIVKSVLKFFFDKTTLDGVRGREADYMIAKNMLNSVYGMMVEKVIRDELLFSQNGYDKKEGDLALQIKQYNENINRFTYFPWGVYVTAWVRHKLYNAIYKVGNDFIYCDTDCVKFINGILHKAYFDRENEIAMQEAQTLAKRLNLDISQVTPTAPDGSVKVLGVWEHEASYARFKTLGAKRYLCEYPDGHHLLTVAGSNKEKTLEYIKLTAKQFSVDLFDVFHEDLVIPPEYAKRLIMKWVDNTKSGYELDYLGNPHYYSTECGIWSKSGSYTFSIAAHLEQAVLGLAHNVQTLEGEYN